MSAAIRVEAVQFQSKEGLFYFSIEHSADLDDYSSMEEDELFAVKDKANSFQAMTEPLKGMIRMSGKDATERLYGVNLKSIPKFK